MSDAVAPQIDLLWVLAHPDDESFGSAATMLLAHDAGMTTGLICATRGEAGEIRDTALATRASLPAVREQELRRATRLAHVDAVRMLGFSDSGMAGTPQNQNPRALVQIPMDELVAHVAAQIRELRPRVVIGFGPDGIYGHPDHVRIGEVLDRAIIVAARDDQPGLGAPWRVSAHYHAVMPRERILISARDPESPFHGMSEDVLSRYGTPMEQITHWIDTRSKAARKHEILMQHLTQISRDNPLVDPGSEAAKTMLAVETYARVALPWQQEEPETDPLTKLRDTFPAPANETETKRNNG